MYSEEELEEIDRRIKESSKKESDRIDDFLKVEYPKKNLEEKVKYWAGDLFRYMRWQEESGNNPYSIYSKNWLSETLKLEPDFLEMLPKIYNLWGGMFDAGKVDRIIKKLLKELSEE